MCLKAEKMNSTSSPPQVQIWIRGWEKMTHFSLTEKRKRRREGGKKDGRERKEEKEEERGRKERKEAKKECKCVFRLKK